MPPKLSTLSNNQNLRFAFYSFWLIVGLFQAYFMPIQADEAYYWLYSGKLDWGFFDHPPMIALWIKIGYSLFQHPIGLRLISVFTFTLSIYIAEKIIEPAKLKLFYVLFLSIAVFHFTSVLAIPDLPLIFFSLLFLYYFKQYTLNTNFKNTSLMGVAMAMMLWSKYHGVLIILFAFFADLKIFKKQWFYWSILVSFILFIPHILWQYKHEFPTLKYHLINRNESALEWNYVIEYISGQILILSLFTGIFILTAITKIRYRESFQKALKFIIIGFLLFFLLMSFRGKIENHWTISIFFPLVILGYSLFESKLFWQKRLFKFFPIIFILTIAGRVYISVDGVKFDSFQFNQSWEKWADYISEKSENKPLLFMNSYQKAALYSFHSGKDAYTLNNIMGRSNQFDIWNTEYVLQGKDVVLIPNYPCHHLEKIESPNGALQMEHINNFRSSGYIKLITKEKEIITKPEQTFDVHVETITKQLKIDEINSNADFQTYFSYQIFDGKKIVSESRYIKLLDVHQKNYTMKITAPAQSGKYKLYVNLHNGYLPSGRNSEGIKLFVK